MNPWVFALLAPAVWGFMNVLDKYIIVHKVKHPIGFAAVAGMVNITLGLILALFLDWSSINALSLIFPIISGGLLGMQIYWYYQAIKDVDASYVLGLYYIYPVVVTFLSLLFLKEILNWVSYLGIACVVAGVLLLSVRARALKMKLSLSTLGIIVFLGAFSEFFVKVSTNTLPLWNGIALSSIAVGAVWIPFLFSSKIRIKFLREVRLIPLALLTEILTLAGISLVYLAMAGLPAGVVSAVGSAQPLAVLIFERIAHQFSGKMTKDTKMLPKLGAIGLIVAGIAILYVAS